MSESLSNRIVLLSRSDEEFSVTSVLASDVIHANRKEIPCILRVRPEAFHEEKCWQYS